MAYIFLFVYFILFKWICMADDEGVSKAVDDTTDLRSETVSNVCSFDPIFDKENPCDSRNVDSVCIVPDTGKIRKCIPMTFQAPFHTSNMSRVLEEIGIKCSHLSYPMNAAVELLVLCKDFPTDQCPGEDYSSREPCKSRQKRQEYSVPQLDADAYYASCENCTVRLKMILDEEKNEVPFIEIRTGPLDEEPPESTTKSTSTLSDSQESTTTTEGTSTESESPESTTEGTSTESESPESTTEGTSAETESTDVDTPIDSEAIERPTEGTPMDSEAIEKPTEGTNMETESIEITTEGTSEENE